MSSVILTSYFSKKKHPNSPNDTSVVGRNSNGFVNKNDFSYIAPWYNSVKNLSLEGRIFHDGLTDDFVEKYSTEKIKFIYADCSSQEYSPLDYRWFCYRDFLKNNQFDSVFISDCSDVTVVKDPSQIINKNKNFDLYVCKDSLKLGDFPYLDIHKKMNWGGTMNFMLNSKRWDLINMGVIGGSFDNVIDFLDKYYYTRTEINEKFDQADMWVGQYVFRHLMEGKKIMVGDPFTSEFKKYENDRKDVYFIHK